MDYNVTEIMDVCVVGAHWSELGFIGGLAIVGPPKSQNSVFGKALMGGYGPQIMKLN